MLFIWGLNREIKLFAFALFYKPRRKIFPRLLNFSLYCLVIRNVFFWSLNTGKNNLELIDYHVLLIKFSLLDYITNIKEQF